MRAPDRTPEGITNRTALCRATLAATVVLLLVTGATVEQTEPANLTATAAAPPATVEHLLTERSRIVARPAATRATARAAAAARHRAVVDAKRAAVVRFARAQRGKWYKFGATGMGRYDCSGLTLRAMRTAGVRLPHSSRAQRGRGVRVPAGNTRRGDLVSYPGHVGVLVARGRMVDAPGAGRRVLERRIYRSDGLQFRRLIG